MLPYIRALSADTRRPPRNSTDGADAANIGLQAGAGRAVLRLNCGHNKCKCRHHGHRYPDPRIPDTHHALLAAAVRHHAGVAAPHRDARRRRRLGARADARPLWSVHPVAAVHARRAEPDTVATVCHRARLRACPVLLELVADAVVAGHARRRDRRQGVFVSGALATLLAPAGVSSAEFAVRIIRGDFE